MADGIVTAVDLIFSGFIINLSINNRWPTELSLWSFDAQKDALEAAARIPKQDKTDLCKGLKLIVIPED